MNPRATTEARWNGPARSRQAGLTLLVTLIMLIMVTLIVVMSYNLGQSNLKIVGNAQDRLRALNAAEAVLNDRISGAVAAAGSVTACNYATLVTPSEKIVDNVKVNIVASVLSETCQSNASFRTAWNTSLTAMQAACTPGNETSEACLAAKAIDDANRRNFLECTVKVAPGVQAPPPNSYCAQINLELRASAEDNATDAAALVTRGVNLLCAIQDIPNSKC
jgi:Tfp pilus assembly protein PilX